MFCEKCGRELQEGWVQCPYCGTKVGDAGNTGPVILKKPAGEKGEELSGNDGAGQEDAHAPSGWDQEIRTDGAGPNMHPAREKASRRGIWKYVFFAVAILAVIGIVSSPGTPEPSEDGNPVLSEISRNSETVESVAADLPVTAEERQDLSDMDLEILLGQSEEKLKDAGFTSEAEAAGYQIMNGAVFADSENGVVALVSILESGDGLPGFHNVKTGMSQGDADRLLGDAYVHAGQQGNEIYYAETHVGIAVVLTVEDGKVTAIQAAKLSEEEMRDLQTAAAQEEPAQSGTGQEETARSEAGQENDGEESTDSEFIFPDSDKRYLTEEEVGSLDTDQLRIARNEIFARHGYIFNSEDLTEYFSRFSWYEGTVSADQFDSSSAFNKYEKKNVEMLKDAENSQKKSSSDDPESQKAIDIALDSVVGKTFYVQDTEIVVEFTDSGEFICYGYYGTDETPESNKICSYYFDTEYGLHKDEMQHLVNVYIDGVEYYFRCFEDGSISLEGDGEFSNWYDPL